MDSPRRTYNQHADAPNQGESKTTSPQGATAESTTAAGHAPPPPPTVAATAAPAAVGATTSDAADGAGNAPGSADFEPWMTRMPSYMSPSSGNANTVSHLRGTINGDVVGVDATASTALELSEREVYSFGQNSYGELGHGHTEERRVPVHVEFCQGKNIVCIAAGNEHTVLLSDTGVVYAAGYNDSGQCGTGNSGRVPTLRAVESFRGKGVVQLACGGSSP